MSATVNMTMSLDECGASCLMNFSCTGYANADSVGLEAAVLFGLQT